ncbi:MAG: hypothetical protein AB7H48_11305 [Parachlamydiales bacterium]
MQSGKWFWKAAVAALLALVQLDAKASDASSDVWLVRRDFIKFGKKEAYEATKKEFLQGFSQFVKKRDAFTFYAIEVFDSPEYLFLTPLGTFGGIERLMKQKKSFQDTFSSQDWEIRRLARASTINFYFRSVQKFLPQCSCIPAGKERMLALPYVQLYWIEITPGQEYAFEQHLQSMADKQMKEESPVCWRVWGEFAGGALPQYLIAVFAESEKDAEAKSEKLEFVPGPYKQIVRKQKQSKGMLRTDLTVAQ